MDGKESSACLLRHQIDRRRPSILLLLNFKSELLALIQRSQSSFLHGTDMHENILPACIGSDKPIALGRVEPLYGALGHRRVAFLLASGSGRKTRRRPVEQGRDGSLPRRPSPFGWLSPGGCRRPGLTSQINRIRGRAVIRNETVIGPVRLGTNLP